MKIIFPVAILIVISIFWFSKKRDAIEAVQNRVVKADISNKKEILKGEIKSFKDVSHLLSINKEEYKENISLNKKNYLVSKSLGATLESQFRDELGKIISKRNGYVIYKSDKISNQAFPVLRDTNKPLQYISTGKIVVSEKDESITSDYFDSLGFKKLDRVERLHMTLYQAPLGFPLSQYNKIITELPAAASATWELVGAPLKLR